MVSRLSGVEVSHIQNPRKEAADNGLIVDNSKFLALNLQPTKLAEGLVVEVLELARLYGGSGLNHKAILPCSTWVKDPVAQASSFKPIEKGKAAPPMANGHANGHAVVVDGDAKSD
jgi:hypothetical protein